MTNSTVTGELFPSSLVTEHELYQQYGHTWWGEPIPDDIMLSGAEGGVRVYTGASGLTVDNVVVTNMRTGFATVHDGGDVNISNSYAYGTTSGFDVGNNTTITGSGGDIVNGPLLVFYTNSAGNSTIDLELVGGNPIGTNWSAAYVNGNNVDFTLSSSLSAGDLPAESMVRLGQSYFENWRNFDYNTADPEDGDPIPLTNSTFTNNTNQMLVIGEDVTGITGSSQAPVITNGKQNNYDGISLIPTGRRTVLVHAAGLGNNGSAAAGTLDANASIVEDGGTLELNPGIQINDEKLTITGNGVDGNGALYSDGQVGSGTRFGSSSGGNESTIFLDGNASIGVGIAGNQMLVGQIQGVGDLTKLGPGTLSMEKATTLDGNLIVAEGEVVGRSGVVNRGLTVAAGASMRGIGGNTLNTTDGAHVDGTFDLNARTDANAMSGMIGPLTGTGLIEASNLAAADANELTIDTATQDALFSGAIQGNINLVKSGAGAQTLSGNLTYLGTTVVNDGTLLVNGTHAGGGDYAIAGGTLGGNGSIDADITVEANGAVGPGASAGQLDVGDITFMTGSTLEIEIGGLLAGAEYDQLLANSVTLGGELSVSLSDSGSLFLPNSADTFSVVSANMLSGAFDNVEAGARLDTAGGEGSFLVTYDLLSAAVVLSDFAAAIASGDFDADGDVDGDDLLAGQRDGLSGSASADWQANYGNASATASAATVPEPYTVVSSLAAAALLAAGRSRRRTSE